jgi:hypothetical protein
LRQFQRTAMRDMDATRRAVSRSSSVLRSRQVTELDGLEMF